MRCRPFVTLVAGLALLAGLEGSASPTAPVGLLGAYTWHAQDLLFGGFSGIELTADGASYIALTDRGGFTRGRITRDINGRIATVTTDPVHLLQDETAAPLQPDYTDSEGLALAPDGTVYISFEGIARVGRYKDLDGPAETLPIARAFPKMQTNSSLETLAIGPDGALYTVPERTGNAAKPFPVYRFQGGKWDAKLSVPRRGSYLPVDADFDPEGRFYLLERDFRGLAGFASRLRRFDLNSDGFTAETTLLETPVGLYDNLEGLSIWRDNAGRLTATMVSDDNFSFFLRTQIVEYHLPD